MGIEIIIIMYKIRVLRRKRKILLVKNKVERIDKVIT